ncbi:MAG: 2-dehydro-3-deoxygalactonokinase [Oscillospiraceae bacterium]
MKKYIVYYDSGTTNSRIYLLDGAFNVLFTAKRPIGSRNSAMEGSNMVVIRALRELYDEMLQKSGIDEDEIGEIYGSGMLTSPYGLHEIPHLTLPVTVKDFAENVYPHFEDKLLHRTINLVPGMKTVSEDIAYVNNMRGEEIEILGTLDDLEKATKSRNIALILPGSHTHVVNVMNGDLKGIISNLTGEVFHALKTETIMAPILSKKDVTLIPEQVKKGVDNLLKFGFSRAIYICHAMRLFNVGTEDDRFSYAEGAISGCVRESLEYYCESLWQGCDTAAIVSNEYMFRAFKAVFDGSPYIKDVVWLPISDGKSYGVQGLKKIISVKNA